MPYDPELDQILREIRRNLKASQKQKEGCSQKRDDTSTSSSSRESETSDSGSEKTLKAFVMAEDNNHTLQDYGAPGAFSLISEISPPTTQAKDFEFKPTLIQLVSSQPFHGLASECPQNHLWRVIDLCMTVKHNGVTQDYIRLSLFKFSLGGDAAKWLENLPPNSLTTWDQVTKAFLARCYPLSKTVEMRSKIMNFKYQEDESLYDAWKHFKALLRACPHHNMENWLQLHCFYNGLSKQNKMTLDAGVGGPIMLKDPTTALQTIESVVQNEKDWSISERATSSKKGGRYDIDSINILNSKVDAMMTQMKQYMQCPTPSYVNAINSPHNSCPPPHANTSMRVMFCDVCGSYDHYPAQCHLLDSNSSHSSPVEQVNALNQRFDPYSNTFNQGWKQHPNIGWRNQGPNQWQGQGQGSSHQFAQNQFTENQHNPQGHFGNNQGQLHGLFPNQGQYSSQRGPPGFQNPRPPFNPQTPQQQPL
ncbi:Translation initiation factor IF-2 [Bienertia sinuspersici]